MSFSPSVFKLFKPDIFVKSMGKVSVYIFACRFAMWIFNFLDPQCKSSVEECVKYFLFQVDTVKFI